MEDARRQQKRAPRLAHKKSRMGCIRCKLRKVKCDEKHPICGGCKRHGVLCEYRQSPPRSESSQTLDSLSTPVAWSLPYVGVDSGLLAESTEKRLLELRLMHHYVSSTCATFPSVDDPKVLETWTVDAPRMAFEHGCLLKALLAVSALHLSRTHPEPAQYAHVHRVYLNAAIEEHRQAVTQIGPQDADAVSLGAAMVLWQAFALYIQEDDQTRYSPPMQWLHLSAAIGFIVCAARPWITEHSCTHIVIFAKPHLSDLQSLFNVKNAEYFGALLTWTPAEDSKTIPPEDAFAYQQLVSYLGTIQMALADNETPTMMMSRFIALGSIMPDHFRGLLGQLNPRALTILAHFFAMTKKISDLWWFKGVAEREVIGIQSILPEAWQPLMAWPLTMLTADQNADGVT